MVGFTVQGRSTYRWIESAGYTLSVHMLRLNELYVVWPTCRVLLQNTRGHMIDGYGRERSMRCKSDTRLDIA
jgi:hypothetical protein